GGLPGAVAVPHRVDVHRRGDALPRRAGGARRHPLAEAPQVAILPRRPQPPRVPRGRARRERAGKRIMKGEFILQVEDVSVSFDGFKAVDALSLYVSKDGVPAVIGPNGAGKTTLLDLITGKTKPTQGHVRFKGEELTGLLEYQIVRKGIGRKFQTPSVYESLTVFENLEMAYPDKRSWFSAWRFRRTAEITKRVEHIAELIYLKDHLHDRA